jgi:hypothetical protein
LAVLKWENSQSGEFLPILRGGKNVNPLICEFYFSHKDMNFLSFKKSRESREIN